MTWDEFEAIEAALKARMFNARWYIEIECVRSIIEGAFDHWLDCNGHSGHAFGRT